MENTKNNHGGSRKGAGRKAGSGIANKIASIVRERTDEILSELMSDPSCSKKILQSYTDENMFSGWLYIIKDESTGLYKVGITFRKRLNQRIATYTSHNMNVSVIYAQRFTDVENVEAECHSMIGKFVRGDWFVGDLQTLENVLTYLSKQVTDGR